MTFVNKGSRPVRVAWVPQEGSDGQVRVRPQSFRVVDRAQVDLLVEPGRPGPLRVALKFTAENDDGCTDQTCVYVRGNVDRKPECRVRPTLCALDEVCVGLPEPVAVQLEIETDDKSLFRVQRRTYELDTAGLLLTERGPVEFFGPYTIAKLDLETTVQTKVSAQKSRGSSDPAQRFSQ